MPDALTVKVNGATEQSLVGGSEISRSLSNSVAFATLSWRVSTSGGWVLDNLSFNLPGASELGTGTLNFRPQILDEIEILDSTSTAVFKGVVVAIDESYDRSGLCLCRVTCRDLSYFIVNTAWTQMLTLPTQSDRDYIEQFLTETGLLGRIGFNTAKVDEIDTGVSLAPPSGFLWLNGKAFMSALTERTGARWHVDASGDLVYKAANSFSAASFDVSDNPDDVSTFAFHNLKLTRLFDKPANLVWVIGDEQLSTSVANSTSQSKYGTLSHIIRDGTLAASAQLTKRAQTVVDGDTTDFVGANPLLSGSFEVRKDGLDIGELINITSADAGLSAEEVLIQGISIINEAQDRNLYHVSFGNAPASVETEIATISRDAQIGATESTLEDPDTTVAEVPSQVHTASLSLGSTGNVSVVNVSGAGSIRDIALRVTASVPGTPKGSAELRITRDGGTEQTIALYSSSTVFTDAVLPYATGQGSSNADGDLVGDTLQLPTSFAFETSAKVEAHVTTAFGGGTLRISLLRQVAV